MNPVVPRDGWEYSPLCYRGDAYEWCTARIGQDGVTPVQFARIGQDGVTPVHPL